VVAFPKSLGYCVQWPESYFIRPLPVDSQPLPPEDNLFILSLVCWMAGVFLQTGTPAPISLTAAFMDLPPGEDRSEKRGMSRT